MTTIKLTYDGNKNLSALISVLLQITIMFFVNAIDNRFIMFAVITLLFIEVFRKAKFSFFSAFSFILWFSYLQEYIADIDVTMSGGMLSTNTMTIYINELFLCTSFFFIFELFIFNVTKVIKNEKIIYTSEIKLTTRMALIFDLIALILIILSYPTFPTLKATLSRNEGLVQSARWVQIAVFLLGLTYDRSIKRKSLFIIWAICIIWVLFHGERVIIFGFLIYCALKFMNSHNDYKNKIKNKIEEHKKFFIVAIIAIIVASLGIYLQLSRSGFSTSGLNFKTMVRSLLTQGTCCDVVYVFNCTVDMWKKGNCLNGYTFLQYIVCWVPFLDNPYYPAAVIMKYYHTLGGGLFFAEPMMNFGIIGTFIFTMIFLLFLCFVLRNPTQFKCYFWIPFVIIIFRMTWYAGLDAWVTMSVYIAPVLYLVGNKIKLI